MWNSYSNTTLWIVVIICLAVLIYGVITNMPMLASIQRGDMTGMADSVRGLSVFGLVLGGALTVLLISASYELGSRMRKNYMNRNGAFTSSPPSYAPQLPPGATVPTIDVSFGNGNQAS